MYLDVRQALPALAPELERVERRLLREVDSDLDFVRQVASHLINAGGRRIRPSLTLACAAIGMDDMGGAAGMDELDKPDGSAGVDGGGGRLLETSITAAAAVELVHLGSLHHDDVMDNSPTRRGAPSVNEKYSNTTAVLSGDFLLARASVLAAQVDTAHVAGFDGVTFENAAGGGEVPFSQLLAATIAELCEGQIRENQDAYNPARTIADYEQSIGGKTAVLLATACRVGAATAGLDRAETDALTDFGRSYGMAFQILDDINDIAAGRSSVDLGKPSGQDMLEGNYTLPVLITLASDSGGGSSGGTGGGTGGGPNSGGNSDGGGAELAELLSARADLTPAQLERALTIVRRGPGIAAARDVAHSWVNRAIGSLDALRDNIHSSQLRQAAQGLARSMLGDAV